MYEIIIGRDEHDRKKYGKEGTILLGRHYVKMGQTTSLSNTVRLDITRAHVIFVCGKRGGGKSYTMGVIAEGLTDLPHEIQKNLSIILLDTMGIYWTMKYANKKDAELLREWGLKEKSLDVRIFTPHGFFQEFKEKGIPTDVPFAIKPSELDSQDWLMTFELESSDPVAVLIETVIFELKKKGKDYSIEDIIKAIKADNTAEGVTKSSATNRFMSAERWGIFDKEGTPLSELAAGGQITVLDLSCYAVMPNGWKIKSLVVGLVSEKLFIERMVARRNEEFEAIHNAVSYFEEDEIESTDKLPLVWLVVDEAHEFLPREGKTAATDPLVTILREGRQPGISLILASQQPGKIHSDVMTQSDTFISHRVTAKIDTDALAALMQSYMREGLDKFLNELPRVKGAALILDDTNEKIYPIKIRPRFTWHGGESPTAMPSHKQKPDI